MTDDYIVKDYNGNDVDISEDMVSYIRSIQFLKDIFCSESEKKSFESMNMFFHELKATLVGLLGGVSKSSRGMMVKEIFTHLDIMKGLILRDLNTIENDDVCDHK